MKYERTAKVCDRIKLALSLRNMTQQDLVNITGIQKGSISQYTTGYVNPKQDRIYLIAKALNVSESWLMGFDVPMEKQQELNDEDKELFDKIQLDADFRDTLKQLIRLDTYKQKLVLDMINTL